MPDRYADPFAPLLRLISGHIRAQMPYATNPTGVYVVVSVNATAKTAQLREPSGTVATGYSYPWYGAAPTVGARVLVHHAPSGPYITQNL